jgi:hypothetical protein
MHTPEQTVSAFIRAYHAWNDRANESAKSSRGSGTIDAEAIAAAAAEYGELVARFCAPSVVRQAISYGDESAHHPDLEAIESVAVSGREATVRTRHVGLHDFVSEYEYRLAQMDGEWRITSLMYLDEGGGSECL